MGVLGGERGRRGVHRRLHARNGPGRFSTADVFLFGALLTAGLGYAEGGRLAREMPGGAVVSWALVLVAPITVPVTAVLVVAEPPKWSCPALAGLAYLAVVSMFLGFFAWYSGLARAGVARASQVQLAQPLLTLLWSWLLLGEHAGHEHRGGRGRRAGLRSARAAGTGLARYDSIERDSTYCVTRGCFPEPGLTARSGGWLDRKLTIPEGGFWPAPEVPQPNIYPMEWQSRPRSSPRSTRSPSVWSGTPPTCPGTACARRTSPSSSGWGSCTGSPCWPTSTPPARLCSPGPRSRRSRQHEEDPVGSASSPSPATR